uniref:Uncharacterized protein n=1 Tax=Oryza meridionalis TaxID=40149 RepID=A0A0E0CPE9_9ORYZ
MEWWRLGGGWRSGDWPGGCAPRRGGFVSIPSWNSIGGGGCSREVASGEKRPNPREALPPPAPPVAVCAPEDDRSEATPLREWSREKPSGSTAGIPNPALSRSGGPGCSRSPAAPMIQFKNDWSGPAALPSVAVASQPSPPTSPTSSAPGIGGNSHPPPHSSFPPPPCSPGAPHLVAPAAAVLLSETAATPVESAEPPPRDDDSVDVEYGGLGLRVQSSTDLGSTTTSPPFPAGQNSSSLSPPPWSTTPLLSAPNSAALIYLIPHNRASRSARSGSSSPARRGVAWRGDFSWSV